MFDPDHIISKAAVGVFIVISAATPIILFPLAPNTLANPPRFDIFIESPEVGEAGRFTVATEPVVEVNIYKLFALPSIVCPDVTSSGTILRLNAPVFPLDCPISTLDTNATETAPYVFFVCIFVPAGGSDPTTKLKEVPDTV